MDSNEFLDLAVKAGLAPHDVEGTAEALEISVDYAKQLRAGRHKITAPIRGKLDALIAAKANGPDPVEQDIIDQADDAVEPAEPTGDDLKYYLEGPTDDGGWNVVRRKQWVVEHKMIARTWSKGDANKICDLLNKERG